MYTNEDIASMSVSELQMGLELFFADCNADLLRQAAERIKQGTLQWAQVEEVIGLDPDEGLAALLRHAA